MARQSGDARFQGGEDFLQEKAVLGPGEVGEALDDGAGGEAVAEVADADRSFEGAAPGGEVEVHGDFAGEHDGEIRDDGASPGREDDADAVARAVAGDDAAEGDAGGEEGAAAEGAAIHAIDDGGAKLALFQSAQAGLGDVSAEGGALLKAGFAELEEAGAEGGDIGLLGGDGGAEFDDDGVAEAPRPFEEEFAAGKGEDAAPELVEPDGDDGTFRAARDEFVAALQPEEDAAARKLALGEDADDFALLDELDGGADGVFGMPAGDGDGADGAEDGVEQRKAVDFIPDDEANGPRAGELQDEGIDVGEVIREEEEAAAREALRMARGDAVDEADEDGGETAEEALGEREWRMGGHGAEVRSGERESEIENCAGNIGKIDFPRARLAATSPAHEGFAALEDRRRTRSRARGRAAAGDQSFQLHRPANPRGSGAGSAARISSRRTM